MLTLTQRRMNLALLFLLSLMEMFISGMTLVLFLPLFLHSNVIFNANVAQAERLEWMGLALALPPLTQFLSSGMLGYLSDRYGRKSLLLMSIMGNVMSGLGLVWAIACHSLPLLLLGRLVNGLFAGNMAISQAAIADMNLHNNKVAGFNYLEIGLGLGMTLGPWLGSLLLKQTADFLWPFSLNVILLSAIGLSIGLYFKETENHIGRLHQAQWVVQGFKLLARACSTPKIRTLLLGWAVFMLGWTLYLKFFTAFLRQTLGLSQTQIGHTYAYMGVVYLACQLLVVMPLAKKIITPRWLMPSMLAVGISLLALGSVTDSLALLIILVAYMLAMACFLPAFHARLSDLAPEHEQGTVFGMSVAVHALMSVVSGLIGGPIAAVSSRLTILVAGGLIIFSFFLLMAIAWVTKTGQNLQQ